MPLGEERCTPRSRRPVAGLTSAEKAGEWTQISSWPSPSKSSTSQASPSPAPKLGLGGREVAPDRVAEVRAGRGRRRHRASRRRCTARVRSRGAPRADRRARRDSAESACIFLCIRLDSVYFDQEVAPVRAADQRAVGARDARLAEVALEPRQPERGVGRQRPALHLAIGRGRQVREPAARHRVERLVQPAQHRPRRSPPARRSSR